MVRGEETPILPSSSSSCFYSVPERQTGPFPDTLFSLRLFGGETRFFFPGCALENFKPPDVA